MLTTYKQDNPMPAKVAYHNQEAFAAALEELDPDTLEVVEAWIVTVADWLERSGRYRRLRIANPRREAMEIVARLIVHDEFDSLLLRTLKG